MKAAINEGTEWFEITLEPETLKEFQQMLRYSKNAKKVYPSVTFSFSDEPYLNVFLRKKCISKQMNLESI